MAGENDKLEIVPERPVEVHETRKLFRLAPAAENDLSRSSRRVAIVAADTKDEARQIASMHDTLGRNWRDPHFAACDSLETSETRVFGDVIFRSEPVASRAGSVWRNADNMERGQLEFLASGADWPSATAPSAPINVIARPAR